MSNIDDKLKRFHSLPFPFYAVVGEIEAHDQPQGDLTKYVDYLLDDSRVPHGVRETLKPDFIESPISWNATAAYYKLLLFRKGVSEFSKNPSILDRYRENDFSRLDELKKEQFSALRIQLKDEMIKEIVRAYIEGVAAGEEASLNRGSPDKATNLTDQIVHEYEKNRCINARVKKRLFAPNENEPIITFFMIVTDRDVLIADYSIKSFSLLGDLKFKLMVFCNWVTSPNRARYFEKWRRCYPFIEIIEPEWMTEENRPGGASSYGYGLEGPYERCEIPWDRELPKYKSKYYATIDADFEILNPEFINVMLDKLEKSATAGWIGTDQTMDRYYTYRDIPGKNMLHSRIDTWCAIYKRETLACNVSHLYYEEKSSDEDVNDDIWDSSGFTQLAMRYIHGYQELCISRDFQYQFIHYAAFSKNKHLDESNIDMYRQLMILRKIGHEQLLDARVYSEYKVRLQDLLRQVKTDFPHTENVSQLATRAYSQIFRHVDNSNPYKKKI
jgi:hypothetical protein